ncbi:MAG: ATP-binding domain-containing protein [Sulfuricurvum sp.]
MNSLFYNHVEKNEINTNIIEQIEEYLKDNKNEQIYVINAPLGEKKYSYDYEENAIVILSPKHRIIFLDLDNNEDKFEEYYEDFIEDLSALSDKFKYKEHIGRPREWKKKELMVFESIKDYSDIETLLNEYIIPVELKRINELLISLIIGSINNIKKIGVDTPKTLLEKVRNNIILFDGQQTRFIYQEFSKKSVSIQGLSGTGKTELLLHKLKELYTSKEDVKIFFTCHNIALANTLKKRIPEFFNFMKVEKQIEWNKQIWIDRAWGSQKDKNSGLYSYICHFYNIPFMRFSYSTTYEIIFKLALEHINKLDENEFKYAFDYILIDERQDFPDVFFGLCEKIAKHKVYIAGDIFQDIFESADKVELNVDVLLNRCYRTDPRTLMFAHAIGMGLFEDKKFNWLTDEHWEASGYKLVRNGRDVCLYREPIRRFEDLELEKVSSMKIQKHTDIVQIIEIIKTLQKENETLIPDDVAIIILDDNKTIYTYADRVGFEVKSQLGWEINRAYNSKVKIENTLFVTNRNNVKGLEFPFVICVTAQIKDDYRYRNSLYTMLTRSFVQSYLLVLDDSKISIQQKGLDEINQYKCIKTIEPTNEEKEKIKSTIVKVRDESNISYDDFLTYIFNDLQIDSKCRKKLKEQIVDVIEEKFDRDATIEFIEANKKFYCK